MENEINKDINEEEEQKAPLQSKSESEEYFEEDSDEEIDIALGNLVFESELGKKDYWDNFYSKEINQYQNNSELIGDIWFGEQVQNKVVSYIKEKFNKDVKIVDVGCGNAAFILKLANLGFTKLYGMDYSEKSIQFANQILKEKLNSGNININIELFQQDINSVDGDGGGGNNNESTYKEFDLIHDKGTFDAFMLCKENKVENYIQYIIRIAKSDSVFILTSCNYSQEELTKVFLTEKKEESMGLKFKLIENIPHKSFSFGGSKGQAVTTLVMSVLK